MVEEGEVDAVAGREAHTELSHQREAGQEPPNRRWRRTIESQKTNVDSRSAWIEGYQHIGGGFARGGSTSLTKKRHLKSINSVNLFLPHFLPNILFRNEDRSFWDPKQDDPVMITTIVANWRFRRILVDQGSTTDVLLWSILKKTIYL